MEPTSAKTIRFAESIWLAVKLKAKQQGLSAADFVRKSVEQNLSDKIPNVYFTPEHSEVIQNKALEVGGLNKTLRRILL